MRKLILLAACFGLVLAVTLQHLWQWWQQPFPAQRSVSVTINSGSALSHRTPWGGFKQSGLGRRYGEMGLEPFFEYKTVWIS